MNDTIQISRKNAMEAYANANLEGKKLLCDLLGKDNFLKITERVKTFEDACAVLDMLPTIEDDYRTRDEIAYIKLKTIAKALNEGWTPDWNNTDECKYYPYFAFERGRFVYFHYNNACSYLGSRLCFKTRELAEYAGKQFMDLYNDFFNV